MLPILVILTYRLFENNQEDRTGTDGTRLNSTQTDECTDFHTEGAHWLIYMSWISLCFSVGAKILNTGMRSVTDKISGTSDSPGPCHNFCCAWPYETPALTTTNTSGPLSYVYGTLHFFQLLFTVIASILLFIKATDSSTLHEQEMYWNRAVPEWILILMGVLALLSFVMHLPLSHSATADVATGPTGDLEKPLNQNLKRGKNKQKAAQALTTLKMQFKCGEDGSWYLYSGIFGAITVMSCICLLAMTQIEGFRKLAGQDRDLCTVLTVETHEDAIRIITVYIAVVWFFQCIFGQVALAIAAPVLIKYRNKHSQRSPAHTTDQREGTHRDRVILPEYLWYFDSMFPFRCQGTDGQRQPQPQPKNKNDKNKVECPDDYARLPWSLVFVQLLDWKDAGASGYVVTSFLYTCTVSIWVPLFFFVYVMIFNDDRWSGLSTATAQDDLSDAYTRITFVIIFLSLLLSWLLATTLQHVHRAVKTTDGV